MKCGIARSSRKKTVRRLRCEVVLDDELDRMLVHARQSMTSGRTYTPNVAIDKETAERIDQPVAAEAEHEATADARRGDRADADQRAGARQPQAPDADRARQRGQAAEGAGGTSRT